MAQITVWWLKDDIGPHIMSDLISSIFALKSSAYCGSGGKEAWEKNMSLQTHLVNLKGLLRDPMWFTSQGSTRYTVYQIMVSFHLYQNLFQIPLKKDIWTSIPPVSCYKHIYHYCIKLKVIIWMFLFHSKSPILERKDKTVSCYIRGIQYLVNFVFVLSFLFDFPAE